MLAVVVTSSVLLGCGDTPGVVGYWQGNFFSGRQMIAISPTDDHYLIRGMRPLPDVVATMQSGRLTYRYPSPPGARLVFTTEQGGDALRAQLLDDSANPQPLREYVLRRADGDAADLREEMLAGASRLTSPLVKENIRTLAGSLRMYAHDHAQRFPPRAALRPSGWFWGSPVYGGPGGNPVTGKTAQLRHAPGDFDYSTNADRSTFSLVGYFENGGEFKINGR